MTAAWRRTPLWLRLITAVLTLAFLGLTLTGVFGARLLRGYLVDRVDEQLYAGANELVESGLTVATPPQVVGPTQFHLQAVDNGGSYLWDVPRVTRTTPELPTVTRQDTRDLDGQAFTVDADPGQGHFRSVAVPATGGGTFLLSMNLSEVDATVNRLVHIDVLVGLAVLGGLAVVGYSMVRTALHPLTEIELTAAAIGRGDLSRRVPDHHPATEMGRLSRALNAMLEQVERAFGARAASEARARRSEERMRRFIADASHELRTPLTSIRGFAELHRQGAVTDPSEMSELLSRIEDEATRMGLLVDDLLQLARLDQERPLTLAPVDLVDVVGSAVAAAQASAPDREIDVEAAGDGDLSVSGDEPRLRQVVTNLLDNALAYSPASAPVTVRLGSARRDERDLVSIEVVDRGPGLTAEQSERVFERFYRVDAARSRAQGGTGLGLSIVAAITRAHGGTVEVDSTPGHGTTFRVLLPRNT
ncbi:MAG TPA: HAMP domain-containing sensor histidine kinase, partial [Acidimicrobiales bacterium]